MLVVRPAAKTLGHSPNAFLWMFRTAAVVLLMAFALSACTSAEPMMGTVLSASSPAPPFELTNQSGNMVALSDYRGRVVVLTFLYTYCRDICPDVTHKLKQTRQLLGDEANEAAFVAISVDPERDSIERVLQYTIDWGIQDQWVFLLGDMTQLAPVWAAYYVDPAADGPAGSHSPGGADVARGTGGVDALPRDIAGRYQVTHSAPVYLIDREGLLRVLFTPPLDPNAIVHDIRVLLN